MNEVILRSLSVIPLKYVGDTGVQSIPCTVTDMIDQGVLIADGRYDNESCWEGEHTIISPTIPNGATGTCWFTALALSPANPAYQGAMAADFSDSIEQKYAYFLLSVAPPL